MKGKKSKAKTKTKTMRKRRASFVEVGHEGSGLWLVDTL